MAEEALIPWEFGHKNDSGIMFIVLYTVANNENEALGKCLLSKSFTGHLKSEALRSGDTKIKRLSLNVQLIPEDAKQYSIDLAVLRAGTPPTPLQVWELTSDREVAYAVGRNREEALGKILRSSTYKGGFSRAIQEIRKISFQEALIKEDREKYSLEILVQEVPPKP